MAKPVRPAPPAPGAPRAVRGATGGAGQPLPYDVYDSAGNRIGRDIGVFSSYQTVLTDAGAILSYDANPGTAYPVGLLGGPLYFDTAGCAGTPYTNSGAFPAQFAQILQSPPVPGSPIYAGTRGSLRNFTYQSYKDSTGCHGGSGPVTNMQPMKSAGTVPNSPKPLVLKAVG